MTPAEEAYALLARNRAAAIAAAARLCRKLEEAKLAGRDDINIDLIRQQDAEHRRSELEKCSSDVVYWFNNYVFTYDPRLCEEVGIDDEISDGPVRMLLWPKQIEMVEFILARMAGREQGLIEKSRDVGASYVCCGIVLHHWLFRRGFKATLGSRNLRDVDTKGQPDSLFEKLRVMLYRLPAWMMPDGFRASVNDHLMLLKNPANGSTIAGEGGEQMGRGGRATVYILDEAAFVRNAESVEAALSGHSDTVLWVSSVNGMGNLFARKRHGGLDAHQIFRIHWKDDPRKSEEWAAKKKAQMSDPAQWASEYEIDYSASIADICIPASWVQSSIQLCKMLPDLERSPVGIAGLDVGGSRAKSVLVTRHGPVVTSVSKRGDPDTTGTAYWALELAVEHGCQKLNYDPIGVGEGVKSTLHHALAGPYKVPTGIEVSGENVGSQASHSVVWPDGRTSHQTFANLKAEIWWTCRERLKKAHEHLLALEEDPNGVLHDIDDLLLLAIEGPDADALIAELSLPQWLRTEGGKIILEGKKQLAQRGIRSPDFADALMLTFVPEAAYQWYVGA